MVGGGGVGSGTAIEERQHLQRASRSGLRVGVVADASLGRRQFQTRPLGVETGHSQMQNRPRNSATPMSEAGQTGPELGFSLNAWPGRRDAARP
jgi:hypothetical protein